MLQRHFKLVGLVLVALLLVPAFVRAQYLGPYDFPSAAVIRGENVRVRVDPAIETDDVAILQRGDEVTLTGEAVKADGWVFVPVETADGNSGWVRDLFIDPGSVVATADGSTRNSNQETNDRSARNDRRANSANDVSSSADDAGQPTSGFTAEETLYAAQVLDQIGTLTSSMQDLTELTSDPQLGDTGWTIRVAAVIQAWRSIRDEAEKMTPPDAYKEVHDTYLQALDDLNAAGDDIAAGIDNLDADRLTSAQASIQKASDELAEAGRLADEVAASRAQ